MTNVKSVFPDSERANRAQALIGDGYELFAGSCLLWRGLAPAASEIAPVKIEGGNFVTRTQGLARIDNACPVRAGILVNSAFLGVSCDLGLDVFALVEESISFVADETVKSGMSSGILNVAVEAHLTRGLQIAYTKGVLGLGGEMEIFIKYPLAPGITVLIEVEGSARREGFYFALNGPKARDYQISPDCEVRWSHDGNLRTYTIKAKS